MNIMQRVENAAMKRFPDRFSVMDILRDCNQNQTEPRLQVVQVLRVLRGMARCGKLEQAALGRYEWKQ